MAVAHRIGTVPILEPSVIIAVSSAHRRDALEVRDSHAGHVSGLSLKQLLPVRSYQILRAQISLEQCSRIGCQDRLAENFTSFCRRDPVSLCGHTSVCHQIAWEA